MTVIAFEGLMGSIGRWVSRGLLSKLPVEVERYWFPWTYSALNFGKNDVIVIGHSFGVRAAIGTATKSPNCKLLLLLDPRMPPSGIGGGIAPKGVKTVCIYRKGLWLPGYECEGAENIELTDGTGHTGVPFHPLAWKYLKESL